MAARQLGEAGGRTSGHLREFHLDDQLARSQVGLEQALEEILRLHLALALGAAQHQRGAERDRAGRQFRRRVGIGKAAADGAAVADRDVSDMRRGLCQQRQVRADDRGR